MSKELKSMLSKVAEEDNKREEKELEQGIQRYKAFLLKIAQDKTLDLIISFEGTQQADLSKNEQDLSMLQRANLVKEQTKFTHRNTYRQYELTKKGAELAEKLSKET
jgi:hypothetical protein